MGQPEIKETKEIKDETLPKSENGDASEFERLKKMESRFVGNCSFIIELARAYKALKSKYDQVENIITQNSTITELKLPNDFANLENMIKTSQQSFEADKEIKKLLNQINDMKQSYEKEADTNADMYSAMQSKLISREEEINRLKHKLSKLEGTSTPTEDNSGVSTPTSTDPITLKLKIRELATALKNVTEQRNSVIEKLKTVESNGGLSTNSSQDSLPEKVDIAGQLEAENSNLKMKISTQSNTISALKSKIQTLTSEHEAAVKNSKMLTEEKKKDDQTIAELRAQATAMVDDLAELTDESEKLKSKISTLNQQLKEIPSSASELEQVRQEARERYAALEFRLRTVQQKLETSENSNVELLNELTLLKSSDRNEEISDSETVDKFKAELEGVHNEIAKLKEENQELVNKVRNTLATNENLNLKMKKMEKEKDVLEKRLKGQAEKLEKHLEQERKEKGVMSSKIKEMEQRESDLQSSNLVLQNKARALEEINIKAQGKESELVDTTIKLQQELDSQQAEYLSKASSIKHENANLKLKLKQLEEMKDIYESFNQNIHVEADDIGNLILRLEEIESIITTNEGLAENLDITALQKARNLFANINSIILQKPTPHIEEDIPDDNTVTNEDSEVFQKLNELTQEIRTFKTHNIELQNNLNNLKLENQEKKQLMENQLVQKAKLEGKNGFIEEQLLEYTQLNSQLQSQIRDLENDLDSFKEKESNLANPEELELLNSQINELKIACNEKDQQISDLLLKNENLSGQSQETEGIKELNEEMDSLKGEVQKLEDEKRSLDKQLSESRKELEETQKKLTLEEEKKTKSIQLLRNSKNRILKLENEVQTKSDEAKKLQDELESKLKILEMKEKSLKEKEIQLSGLLLQKEEQENRLQKMHALNLEMDSLKKELLQEQKKAVTTETEMAKKIEEIKQEYELKIQQHSESHVGNEEGLKNEIKQLKGEIEQLQSNLTAADNRIENIDSELATSKSLFEMKCIENDNLKLSISEMEVKYFESSQEQLKLTEEYSVLKNAVNLGQKKIEEIQNQLQAKQAELDHSIKLKNDAESEMKKVIQQKDEAKSKLENLEKLHKENQRGDEDMIQQSALLTTLKEEVKKLSKPGSSASSVVSSPRLSRADSHDIPPAMKYSPPAVSPTRNSIQSNKPQLPLEPEYLKNVVLKFLESSKKAQRVQLVGVLGILLNFTPDELKAAQKSL
ncbi:hypothetical protein HK103_002131 [Boothiomyces macroporosus]|uniref:GRIP domain-containing protein n=1 Tax=Boothiomyces macroporosus TaxID=261099 RepID=A0AAD5UMJ9_9FUNG|nr:hypothetical protein HK103_002131 [Boothiomyces macroporosus]